MLTSQNSLRQRFREKQQLGLVDALLRKCGLHSKGKQSKTNPGGALLRPPGARASVRIREPSSRAVCRRSRCVFLGSSTRDRVIIRRMFPERAPCSSGKTVTGLFHLILFGSALHNSVRIDWRGQRKKWPLTEMVISVYKNRRDRGKEIKKGWNKRLKLNQSIPCGFHTCTCLGGKKPG